MLRVERCGVGIEAAKLVLSQNTRSVELFKAAGFGSVTRVQALLDGNVDPNVRVVYGRTALMQSASWGHVACVQALIDGDADICTKDPGGKSALFLAKVYERVL